MDQSQFRELVDIETVAKLLGVGERYVRRMVANREIEVVKVGHYVRFDLDVVRHSWTLGGDRRRRVSRREIRPMPPCSNRPTRRPLTRSD